MSGYRTHLEGEQERNTIDQYDAILSKLQNEIRNLKEQCYERITTKCYQLKIHRTSDGNFSVSVDNFHERGILPVLHKIKLIQDQWKTLDLLEVVQNVNPHPMWNFGGHELLRQNSAVPENIKFTTFGWLVLFCCIFENIMQTLGRKAAGDTLDIAEDVCDVVGNLIMEVPEQDRPSVLDCMRSAIINIQASASEPNKIKLRSLLITDKKYSGLNLACILLEQIIIDSKDKDFSWLQTVCSQFIDLVVQVIIEPEYQQVVRCNLTHLLKSGSKWKVADVYNIMKDGILMFQYRQEYFPMYLNKILHFAVTPNLHTLTAKNGSSAQIRSIIYCRDENSLRCLNYEAYGGENDKSLEQVLSEMKDGEIGEAEKDSIRNIVRMSRSKLSKYTNDYGQGILLEIKHIRNSEHDEEEVLSSCLAVTSIAFNICKGVWPWNTQLVSYGLVVARRTKKKGRLLEILTGEGKSCVIAMVAATYALLGKTVDIVTCSPVLSQRDAEEWREFYTVLNLESECNIDTKEDGRCYKCPIVYGTVETFARDILKTEFLLQDARKGRICDIVIVDEVDSMLIDQGVQCTYLIHEVGNTGMFHFEPILAFIWMHVSLLTPVILKNGVVLHWKIPEVFFYYSVSIKSKNGSDRYFTPGGRRGIERDRKGFH